MTSEPPGAQLIESYLQTRGSRYFRGQHDGEFFYVANTRPRRLHVHLETSPEHGDVLVIRVAPACFFPAAERPRLTHFAETWNRQDRGVTAIVHDSSDPQRIGVVARRSHTIARGASFDDFASFVDATLADAIDLFGQLAQVADLPATGEPLLRDAS
jgi:Putative bacterial sensory transduction regulator